LQDSSTSLEVTFWGTRGSIATPGTDTFIYGGNTSCIQVATQQANIILDAGTGIRQLGKKLIKTDLSNDYHIFLSHTHWDHIQGIPFFHPAYIPGNTIHFYGATLEEQRLKHILTGQMNKSYFPVQMNELPAEVIVAELQEGPVHIGDICITFEDQIYHPGGSQRYKITAGNASIVYATDVEIDAIHTASPGTPQAEHYQQYCQFIANADLLIADTQYTRKTYEHKKGWGHSTVETIMETAAKAGVKQLAFFHHDPDLVDDDLSEREKQYASPSENMKIFWAKEGKRLSFPVA
jgi:phosphoribosyl 1,2-cyclic phosphodiesterase